LGGLVAQTAARVGRNLNSKDDIRLPIYLEHVKQYVYDHNIHEQMYKAFHSKYHIIRREQLYNGIDRDIGNAMKHGDVSIKPLGKGNQKWSPEFCRIRSTAAYWKERIKIIKFPRRNRTAINKLNEKTGEIDDDGTKELAELTNRYESCMAELNQARKMLWNCVESTSRSRLRVWSKSTTLNLSEKLGS